MNLMFRKNFREGKSGGGGGGGGLKHSKSMATRNQSKQRSRDMSITMQDEVHYRTHLFFSPNNTRPSYSESEGSRSRK